MTKCRKSKICEHDRKSQCDLSASTQVLRLLRKVARGCKNERHTINGREVRQEEHDLLQALRQKNNELAQRKVRFLWFWKKQEIARIQLE